MLRRSWTLPALAVLLALPLSFLRAEPARAADKDLDGDWEVQSGMKDGDDLPMPPAEAGKVTMSFKGDTLTAKVGDMSHAAAVQTDPTKTPRTIDVTPQDGPEKGKTSHCIYEVKDDVLRLCIADPGKDRPTDFSGKKGTGWTLITFKRAKK